MRRRRIAGLRITALVLAALALGPAPAFSDPDRSYGKGQGGAPPGLAKKGGVPPGQAGRNVLPPGLAKKYGQPVAGPVYVAVDPRYDDRAWFLVDRRWVMREHFDAAARAEVRLAMHYATVAPPVPLPRARIDLRVVVFD